MINSNIIENASSTSKVNAKVELYSGSTLVETCTCNDRLQDFTVERAGQSNKFFGFGVTHRLTVTLIDLERTLEITQDNSFKVHFGYDVEEEFVNPYPTFYASEITRDENTNSITVVAYDLLHMVEDHPVSEIASDYMIEDFVGAAAGILGLPSKFVGIPADDNCLYTEYPNGANFEGTESLKGALTSVAEVTQTIYYLDNTDTLVFRRLLPGYVATIGKNDYYSLEAQAPQTLTAIASVTELGENIMVGDESGVVQYVRENPFWDTRDDVHALLENSFPFVERTAIVPFACEWDGNFLLEPCDCIEVITEDDSSFITFVINDMITYNGSLTEYTQWAYTTQEETATNPSSLGDVIKQTFARVDKVNHEITLHAEELYDENGKSKIAEITVTTDRITNTVYGEDGESGLAKKVETMLTEEDFSLKVKQELSEGVDTLAISETGFVFNNQGLTITQSEKAEMKTNIDAEGLTVYQNNNEVLTATNSGVKAYNLHATTYLTIGDRGDGEGRSKFADYGSDRTGCFWVGR